MGNFNRDDRRGGGGGRSFGGGGGDFNRGPKQMFKAKCAECGDNCEIPFEPRNGRPVFCSSCFEDQGGAPSYKPERRNDRRDKDIRTYKSDDSSNYKKELADISDKLKQIIILMKEQGVPSTPAKKNLSIAEEAKEEEEPKKKAKKASPKTKKIVKKLKAKKVAKKVAKKKK